MNFTSTHLTARNKNNNGTGIFEREDQHNDSGKVIFSKRSSYNIALVKEDLPWVLSLGCHARFPVSVKS